MSLRYATYLSAISLVPNTSLVCDLISWMTPSLAPCWLGMSGLFTTS